MPIVTVVAKMELEGIDLDQEYAKRLSDKYHKLMNDCNRRVNEELTKLKPTIDAWRLSKDATTKAVGNTGKVAAKSKGEQLEDPVNVDSPTQLAILVYDVLKCPQVSTKSPRGCLVLLNKAFNSSTPVPLGDLVLT